MIDKLLKSSSMQKMMLNQFKKALQDEGIKTVTITMNEKGEAEVQYFKEDVTVITTEKYNNIQKQLQSLL